MGYEKKVDYRFKILYAVGIIVVVAYHCYGGATNLFKDWFPYEVYPLPLFAFCSGYFYKSRAEENLPKYYLKKFLSLIVPLYIGTVVYGLLVQVSRLAGFEIGGDFTLDNVLIQPIMNGHEFIYNLGSWFLVPLFMIEIYNVTFRKLVHLIYKDMPEWFFFAVNLALGIFGNNLACKGLNTGWWLVLVRMLFLLSFYEIGILYQTKLEKIDRKIPGFWYFTVLFIIDFAIIYHFGRTFEYSSAWCNNFTEGPVMPIVAGLLGIALWLRIATILEPVIGRSKYLNLVADNTFSIMMNHVLGIMIAKGIFGLISLFYEEFADFDWVSYKTLYQYIYLPRQSVHSLLFYTAMGIVIPILIQKAFDGAKYGLSSVLVKKPSKEGA